MQSQLPGDSGGWASHSQLTCVTQVRAWERREVGGGGCWGTVTRSRAVSLTPAGLPWSQRKPGGWRRSGPGLPLCPSGPTCASGARSSQRLGRSTGEPRRVRGSRGRHPVYTRSCGAGPSSPRRPLSTDVPRRPPRRSGVMQLCHGHWSRPSQPLTHWDSVWPWALQETSRSHPLASLASALSLWQRRRGGSACVGSPAGRQPFPPSRARLRVGGAEEAGGAGVAHALVAQAPSGAVRPVPGPESLGPSSGHRPGPLMASVHVADPSLSTASGSRARWTWRWTASTPWTSSGPAASPLRGHSSLCSTGAGPRGQMASSVSARTG